MSLTAKVLLAGWCIALIPIARVIEGDKHWGWYERRLKLLPLVLVWVLLYAVMTFLWQFVIRPALQ
jgi:hypothetical protein